MTHYKGRGEHSVNELERIVEEQKEELIKAKSTEQKTRISNLSMIVRRMARFAVRQDPTTACLNIVKLFDQSQHLLEPANILRRSDESERGAAEGLQDPQQSE